MPSTVPGHRSSPSVDKLLDQLDETQVYLLLADLNNSPDVHIPVAEAIDFYEKPRRHRNKHGLAAKRAVSSPCLASARRDRSRPITPPPPMPIAPVAMTIPSAREPSTPLALTEFDDCIMTDTVTTDNKRVSSNPLHDGSQDFQRPQTAERDPETTLCANTAPQLIAPGLRRAYKRISRPPMLAESLFNSSDMAVPVNRHLPLLRSSHSMLDLRRFNQRQKYEDDHRLTDVLEPIVLDAWSPSKNSPLGLGNLHVTDAPCMDSLYGVLTGGN
ncbi:hypothetical protein HJFPF1_04276 [Paramyrothecium foliicola]|nr:hypothetical protein HJFPF1_04276 [Paramyrothecium foliicola]